MTSLKKIENAAHYWYMCEQEGYPKGQKEVFEEWLSQDILHKQTYEKLYSKENNVKNDEIIIKKKESIWDVIKNYKI